MCYDPHNMRQVINISDHKIVVHADTPTIGYKRWGVHLYQRVLTTVGTSNTGHWDFFGGQSAI